MIAKASSGALTTFLIFALIGPVFATFLLFLPTAHYIVQWVLYDSTYWYAVLNIVLKIYPLGIWPFLIAGALVVWRDRSQGGSNILFALIAGTIGGAIWILVFEFLIFQSTGQYVFTMWTVQQFIVCIAASGFCWWLSRAKREPSAA